MSRVLRRWFKWNFHKHYVDEKRNRKPRKINIHSRFSKKDFKKKLCIHGHFNLQRGTGVQDYYPEVEQFITFLRDPFEICLSNFFFVKKLGAKAYWAGKRNEVASSIIGIDEYLKKTGSFLLQHFPVEITFDNYKEIIEKHYVYIGITEDLQTSIDNLAVRLGFKTVKVPTLNISPRYGDLPTGARDFFMEKHQLEYAVYEYAMKHYNSLKTRP